MEVKETLEIFDGYVKLTVKVGCEDKNSELIGVGNIVNANYTAAAMDAFEMVKSKMSALKIITAEQVEEAQKDANTLLTQMNEANSGTIIKELPPIEKALAVICPCGDHKGKTLGEVNALNSSSIAWFASDAYRKQGEVKDAAKLIQREFGIRDWQNKAA